MVRVLLADVDPDTRLILHDYLEAQDLRVETCDTSAELFAAVAADPPDALIVEIHDFGGDSLDTVRQLRAASPDSTMPILIFTSSPLRSLLTEARALDVAVIWKPAPPSAVLRTLRRLLPERVAGLPAPGTEWASREVRSHG